MDIVNNQINDYLLAHSEPADEVLRDLAELTHRDLARQSGMQITHDEGELLTMLVRLTGARQAVEVGTFTTPRSASPAGFRTTGTCSAAT
jgi:caffeoyl-CoA O-methyltransferase